MASTNLFKQLYSHDNSKISSGFVCSSARNEDDTSFDISGNQGVITDSNGNTLASIPLDKIHADDISQYNSETRILQPHSCYVLQGLEFGLAMTSYYFHIPEEITEVSEYESFIGIECDIIYNAYEHKHVHISVEPATEASIITAINNCFEENEIDIVATILAIKDRKDLSTSEYLVFQALTEGYFFFIKNVLLTPAIQSADYPDSPFSTEVDDIKFLIYSYIKEYHPVIEGDEYDEDSYEISCDLYNWVLENYESAIKRHQKFADALGNMTLIKEKTEELEKLLQESPDDSEIASIQELILELYEEANLLIEKTVYNHPVIEKYDLEGLYAISNIIESLMRDVEYAKNRYTLNFWLHEHLDLRVPTMKYPNGAFRGIVIIPDYPEDDTYEYSTLYINHILTYVNVAVESHKHSGLYHKEKFGVMSSAMFKQEQPKHHHVKFQSNMQLKTDILDGWDNAENIPFDENDPASSSNSQFNWHLYTGCGCNNPAHNKVFDQENNCCGCDHKHDDIIYMGESCYSDKTKIMGLYKYMEYVNNNNLWLHIGDAYMAIGKSDNHLNNYIYNLLNSVMIYNPNDIPIRISYLIFS